MSARTSKPELRRRANRSQVAAKKILPAKHPALEGGERLRREMRPDAPVEPEAKRARDLAEHLRKKERIRDRQTKEARRFREELDAVIRFSSRILGLSDAGIRVAPEGTGDLFISPIRPGRGDDPLSDRDDVTVTGLLNQRWEPPRRSLDSCLFELSRLAIAIQKSLTARFPSLNLGRPRQDLRRERVRLLAPFKSDAEIALSEGMSRDDHDRIAKDRAELIKEDRRRKK